MQSTSLELEFRALHRQHHPLCLLLGKKGPPIGLWCRAANPTHGGSKEDYHCRSANVNGWGLSSCCYSILNSAASWLGMYHHHSHDLFYLEFSSGIHCLSLSASKICGCLQLSHIDKRTAPKPPRWGVLGSCALLLLWLRVQVFLRVWDSPVFSQ